MRKSHPSGELGTPLDRNNPPKGRKEADFHEFFQIPLTVKIATVTWGMKIKIEMSPTNYDGLLDKVPTDSVAYSFLKNGIVSHRLEDGTGRSIIDILCEPAKAEILLEAATELWPKAAYEIKDSIIRAPKMNATDAHIIRNILVQMLVNARTPEPTDSLDPEQVENLKTLYKDLATYLHDS